MEEGLSKTAPALEETSGSLETLSVKELKAFLDERGVSYADCFEKSDLLARAKESQHIPTKKQPGEHEGYSTFHTSSFLSLPSLIFFRRLSLITY